MSVRIPLSQFSSTGLTPGWQTLGLPTGAQNQSAATFQFFLKQAGSSLVFSENAHSGLALFQKSPHQAQSPSASCAVRPEDSSSDHTLFGAGFLAIVAMTIGLRTFFRRSPEEASVSPQKLAKETSKELAEVRKELEEKKALQADFLKDDLESLARGLDQDIAALEGRQSELQTKQDRLQEWIRLEKDCKVFEKKKVRFARLEAVAEEYEAQIAQTRTKIQDLKRDLGIKEPRPAGRQPQVKKAPLPAQPAAVAAVVVPPAAVPVPPVVTPPVVAKPLPVKTTVWTDELKGLKSGKPVYLAGGAVELALDEGRFSIRITDGPHKPETARISRGNPLLNKILDTLKASQRFQPYDGLSATEPAFLEVEDRLTVGDRNGSKSYRFFLDNGEPCFEAVDFQPEIRKTKAPLPRLETVKVKKTRLTEGALEWVKSAGLDPDKILEKAAAKGARWVDAQGVRDALSIDLPLSSKKPGTVYLTPDPLGGLRVAEEDDPIEQNPVEIGIRGDKQHLVRANDLWEKSKRPHLIRKEKDHSLKEEGFVDLYYQGQVLPTGEKLPGDFLRIENLFFRFVREGNAPRLKCVDPEAETTPATTELILAPIPKDGFSRVLGVWTERGRKEKEKWPPQSAVPDFLVQKFWEGTASHNAQRLIGPEDAKTLFEALSFDLPDLPETPVTLEVGGNAGNGGIKIPGREGDAGIPALLTLSKEAGYLLAAHPKVIYDPQVERGDEVFKAPTKGKIRLKHRDIVAFAGYWTTGLSGKFFADVAYRFEQPHEGKRGRLVFLGTKQVVLTKNAPDFPAERCLHEVVDAQDGKTKFVVEKELRRIEEENERLHEKQKLDAGWIPMAVSRNKPGRKHIGAGREAELAVTDDGRRWVRDVDRPRKGRTHLIRNQKWHGVPADGYVELLAGDVIVLEGVSHQLLEDPHHKDRLWLRPLGQVKVPKTFLHLEKVLVELPDGQTRRFTESGEETVSQEGIDPELLLPQMGHLKGRLIGAEDINELRIKHFLTAAAKDNPELRDPQAPAWKSLRQQYEIALEVYGALSRETRDRFWLPSLRRGTGIPASFVAAYDAVNASLPTMTKKMLIKELTGRLEHASRFTLEALEIVLKETLDLSEVLAEMGKTDKIDASDIRRLRQDQLDAIGLDPKETAALATVWEFLTPEVRSHYRPDRKTVKLPEAFLIRLTKARSLKRIAQGQQIPLVDRLARHLASAEFTAEAEAMIERQRIDAEALLATGAFVLGSVVTPDGIASLRIDHLVKTQLALEKSLHDGARRNQWQHEYALMVRTYDSLPVETLDLLWDSQLGDAKAPRGFLPPEKTFNEVYRGLRLSESHAGLDDQNLVAKIVKEIPAAARFTRSAFELVLREGLDVLQVLKDVEILDGPVGQTSPRYDLSSVAARRDQLLSEDQLGEKRERTAFVRVWQDMPQEDRNRFWDENAKTGYSKYAGLHLPESYVKACHSYLEANEKVPRDDDGLVESIRDFLDSLIHDRATAIHGPVAESQPISEPEDLPEPARDSFMQELPRLLNESAADPKIPIGTVVRPMEGSKPLPPPLPPAQDKEEIMVPESHEIELEDVPPEVTREDLNNALGEKRQEFQRALEKFQALAGMLPLSDKAVRDAEEKMNEILGEMIVLERKMAAPRWEDLLRRYQSGDPVYQTLTKDVSLHDDARKLIRKIAFVEMLQKADLYKTDMNLFRGDFLDGVFPGVDERILDTLANQWWLITTHGPSADKVELISQHLKAAEAEWNGIVSEPMPELDLADMETMIRYVLREAPPQKTES